MTTQNIADLHRAWIDAMWDELCTAHERQHLDASHDIEGDLRRNIKAGPQAYVDGLYTSDGERRTYADRVVDRKSLRAEEAALVLIGAEEGAK